VSTEGFLLMGGYEKRAILRQLFRQGK